MVPEPYFKIITVAIVVGTLIVGIFVPNGRCIISLCFFLSSNISPVPSGIITGGISDESSKKAFYWSPQIAWDPT